MRESHLEGVYGNRDIVDIRAAVPRELLRGPYADEIKYVDDRQRSFETYLTLLFNSFNPIAPTLMQRALQTLLKTHFALAVNTQISPSTKQG